MLGAGMGCVGLSYSDFCLLTLPEFESIMLSWSNLEQSRSRESWMQSRFMAHCALMPHAKKDLKPQDICVFSWEKADKPKALNKKQFNEIKKKFDGGQKADI